MTQHTQPSSEFIVFVTHVEPDNLYLKIWGQLDKQAATTVEHYIYPLVEQFNQGYGCPSKTNRVIIGALCCARFQSEGYYRAKILSVRSDGMIVVQFIDYGNVEVLSPNEIHLLDNIRGSEPLRAYPAMAAEFILLNVLPINGVWENRIVETIKKSLCYNEFKAVIQMVDNHCFIKLWYNNEDFSEVLVREQMALPATLQDMFRSKHMLQSQMPRYEQQVKGNMNNFTTMPIMHNPNINHSTNMQGLFHKTFPPDINQPKAAHPSPLSPPIQEALVFKSRVLDVGSDHEVLVSHVEDGPHKFSVQVKSTTSILTRLMNEINTRPKQPLQEPPLPGSVCLGRYRDAGEAVLCRAVVMSVMEHKCKLYYVDFGHTEILPYTDIFQLSPEYINPKVLSIRFTLSGLKELIITQEMKEYFKDLVYRRLLILHVRPPEGPPLIQYGDLYDNGVNIKDMLKKAFPIPAATIPVTYSYPQLQRLSKDVQEIVHVSYVESCKKFFVQLDNGVKSLESIMAGLTQYAKTASILNIAQLKAGLPCAALYDSQWYRAQILGIIGDKVKVVYVDYGNEEILPVMSLRAIHNDLVTKLPAQAVKCALNGYEVLSSDQEVYNHFERLTLEKRFYMKVVAVQPNSLLVDLFEFDTMRSIHPQLLNNLFCDKTENSAASSRSGEIQHTVKTMNDFQSEEKDKFDKRSNVGSWNRNQNSKSFQDNKSKDTWRNEWSPEKQHDSKRERTGNYSYRDNSQNNRFVKDEATNNRFNRDRPYNKYDKSEMNTSNRGDRGIPRGDGSRFNERRYNRNNSTEKASSDKDSDTSSRSGGKRGKSGFNGSQKGNRDGATSGKWQTANWNDRKPAMGYRSNYKNERFNGNYNTNNDKFRNAEDDTSNVDTYNQVNSSESWDSNDVNQELQNQVTANTKFQLSPINITLSSTKNCEVVFINSPSDFFIQLSPDCLELDSIMENIAATYENGGETMQIFEAQCGTYCIAQYAEDLKWYRAVIKSIDGNNATVEFVDYGNTEFVDVTKIKVIQEEFLKLPMQAVHCKLFGLTDTGNKEDKNAIFLEKVEAKPLQVEFIAEENRMYEVLLREVIDDIPNTNCINEEFCAIANIVKAKETTIDKKAHKITLKKTQMAPDYAPFNSKWQTSLYESGCRHNIIVTWFINPNKLFCQLLIEEAEFKTMMSEIQRTYADREPVSQKLQVGTSVIAIFSEDATLYRAEIVSTDVQKDAYVVQYIDFGNCATVNQCNIYLVEKKFMQLPKLAVQCSLRNIIPINDDWSKVDNDALDNCFSADKYECIFHSFSDNQYTVSLNYNGQDVGDTLVQKNLAASNTRTSTKTIGAMERPITEMEDFSDVERVDISLLTGQTLKMKVSDVKSTTHFHIQLPTATKCENIVDKYMANKDTKVMPRLSTREMCLDTGCLINMYGTWRRAVVINCSRSIGFDIKLIDTGTYNEILDDIVALPGELAVMQNQALECSLQNVPSSSDVDKQLKELEGKEVLVYIEKVNNSRLIVRLYDRLGNGLMNTEGKDAKISPICPMPILSSTHKVCASYADHSASIWLQRYSDVDIEGKLLQDLEKYYVTSGQRLKPEMHLLCAAKCSDGRWYRGKIVSHNETAAYVNYIDYGNTEEVALESIMILEPQFYEPHQLAINVSLSVTLTGTETEQINVLEAHVMNKDFTAIFYNVHNKWIVDLIENGEKLSDKFLSLNLVTEEETISKSKLSSQTQEKLTNDRFEVLVSHVDSPSQFWLQRTDKITSLNEKQDQLQMEVTEFPAMNGIPEEGTRCVAVYSIDSRWYRAEVLDADEDITTVRFIDYGNTDIIDNKTDSIRQIPDAWKDLEIFALKCRLDVIPIDLEDWNESTCERFENLVTSVETLQAVIVTDTAIPKRVKLFINDKSVSETLVEEKHAIIINTEQEPVDEIVELELDPHSAFVCHINSPSEFWVQEEKSVADLEVMADRFMIADMFPRIDEVKEGLLCVAKYPDDEQWYRARVISHDDNGTPVIYIDYGNSAVSTEIRVIPEDLAGIPPLSRKCCLELPPQIKEWSEQAREEFVRLAADGATIFLLDVLKEQETSSVKLTLDGQNVTDILASMCEHHLPIIEERLPPLGEENSPNVVVSHVNSPNEFWIQAESSISELEVMSDRLRDAESFVTLNNLDIGTVCAARYPEDGCWYRAKIIARCEEGTEVLYMDYGNSAITEELKVLPEDIVKIPTLSKRCTLERPSHIAMWSDKACDKFKELVAEGATMFQFETLDEENPMHVRLNLDDTNVTEILLSEHENIPEIKDTDIIFHTEEQQVMVIHEDHQSYDEIISNLNMEVEQEPALNQIDHLDSDNLNYVDQSKKPENAIDEEVCIESFKDLDTNGKYERNEEQEQKKDIAKVSEIKEQIIENNPEITIVECIKTEETLEDINAIVETNEELNVIKNEIISVIPVTPVTFNETSIVTELSIDEIIGNMIRDTVDDVESRKVDNTNSLVEHEMQPQNIIQTDASEDIESRKVNDTNSLIEHKTQPQDVIQIDASEDVESLKVDDTNSLIEHETQPQGVIQTDASEDVKSQKIDDTNSLIEHEKQPRDIIQIDANDDVESRRADDTNSLVEHETQLHEQELLSRMQPIDESLEIQVVETIKATETMKSVIENLESRRMLLNDSPSFIQFDITQIKEEEDIESEVESSLNKSLEILEMTSSLPKEQINLELVQRQNLTMGEFIPDDVDTNNGLENQYDNVGSDKESSVSSGGTTCTVKAADLSPTVIKTDLIEQHSYSRRRSEDKIVPGCVSRGESPVPETKRPVTPKTSHSEKLVAGAVNPIVQTDSTNGNDEILTVSIEDNIPNLIA